MWGEYVSGIMQIATKDVPANIKATPAYHQSTVEELNKNTYNCSTSNLDSQTRSHLSRVQILVHSWDL